MYNKTSGPKTSEAAKPINKIPVITAGNMSPATEAHAPLLHVHGPPGVNSASVSGAVFNIATSIIGAGIMSIPATLKVLGIIPAFVLIVIVGFLVEISVDFLMRFTHSGESITYAGVMNEAFGRVGSVATQVCVMITNIGCLIMYLIIIGKAYILCFMMLCLIFFFCT